MRVRCGVDTVFPSHKDPPLLCSAPSVYHLLPVLSQLSRSHHSLVPEREEGGEEIPLIVLTGMSCGGQSDNM